MRLGTFFLTLAATAASALAQTSGAYGSLPWRSARELPWSAGPALPLDPPHLAPSLTYFPLSVKLSQDGALRIHDDKGSIRLRLGLPGRPLKLWRDWGIPVENLDSFLPFPIHTPLLLGISGLPMGAADFRPALEGLLWILDDDERVITVIHPATGRVAYLPLPGGQDLSLVFHAERLEVTRNLPGPDQRQDPTTWSVPWFALLPHFLQLGQESPKPAREGTVLIPFPKE